VADHRTGAIVWCRPGRNSATLQAYIDELGPRMASIRAISMAAIVALVQDAEPQLGAAAIRAAVVSVATGRGARRDSWCSCAMTGRC
jgi:transposase